MALQPELIQIDVKESVEKLSGARDDQIEQWTKYLIDNHADFNGLLDVIERAELEEEIRMVMEALSQRLHTGTCADEVDDDENEEVEVSDIDVVTALFGLHRRVVGDPMSVQWFEENVLPVIDQALPGFAKAQEGASDPFGFRHFGASVHVIDADMCKRLADAARAPQIEDGALYDYVMPYIAAIEDAAEHGHDLLVHWY